jgi:hypothetical protein
MLPIIPEPKVNYPHMIGAHIARLTKLENVVDIPHIIQ